MIDLKCGDCKPVEVVLNDKYIKYIVYIKYR